MMNLFSVGRRCVVCGQRIFHFCDSTSTGILHFSLQRDDKMIPFGWTVLQLIGSKCGEYSHLQCICGVGVTVIDSNE